MKIATKVNCKLCESENMVNQDNLKFEEFNLLGTNESIQLMYYECVVCHKINIVQIDNDYTLALLKELSKLLAKGMSLRQKSVNRTTLKNEFEKKRELLESERLHLAKKCNGMVASNGSLSIVVEVGELYECKNG